MAATLDLFSVLFGAGASGASTQPAAAPATKRAPRHFYRCADCLTVVATDEKIPRAPGSWSRLAVVCDACGGAIEYMGEVYRDRLTKEELRTPCDERCTGARGPNCECRCGGENHGSGILVAIRRDCGPVPRLMVPPEGRVKAEYYRALVEAFKAAHSQRFGRVTDAKRKGFYLDPSEYRLFRQGQDLMADLGAARAMRSHNGRNKKLEGLLKKLGVEIPAPRCMAGAGALFTEGC